MTTGKHTPGPWTIIERSDETTRINGVNGQAVSAVWCGDMPDGAANARLIASAPELLAALEAHMPWQLGDGSPCSCPVGEREDASMGLLGPSYGLHATTCEDARAAIAKARGNGGAA